MVHGANLVAISDAFFDKPLRPAAYPEKAKLAEYRLDFYMLQFNAGQQEIQRADVEVAHAHD